MAQRGSSPVLRYVIVFALLAGCGWGFQQWRRGRKPVDDAAASQGSPTGADFNGGLKIDLSAPAGTDAQPKPQPTSPIVAAPAEPAKATPEQTSQASRSFQEGLKLRREGDLVEARALLSSALASGLLADAEQARCREQLTEIADRLVFSREVHPGDPYARQYKIMPGDLLVRIVKREGLDVPHEGIQRINGIVDPRRIRVGQKLKLIQGPFDAIITKRTYTLDLYHHGMFVRSFHIGLGQNGSTPEGRFLVRDRVRSAPWTPPPGSQLGAGRVIRCGEAGYPLGTEGLWIALQGLEMSNEMVAGFGIHGTDEPDSIGKQASLGCIRLRDADIAMLFDMFCPGKSKIEVRP